VTPHDSNRRTGNRFKADQVFSHRWCTIAGVAAAIDNVSESGFGLTVRGAAPLVAGQRATIEITDSRATFDAEVLVVWARGQQAGVALTGSTGNVVQRSLVRKLVRRIARRVHR
jgi:hypothetical protein